MSERFYVVSRKIEYSLSDYFETSNPFVQMTAQETGRAKSKLHALRNKASVHGVHNSTIEPTFPKQKKTPNNTMMSNQAQC